MHGTIYRHQPFNSRVGAASIISCNGVHYIRSPELSEPLSSSAFRFIDIANEMNFKKPSVSVAMKNLRENGFITVSPEGYIHLTESGREVAEKIYERHTTLSSWLVMLGVDPRIAAEDACKIEHDVSAESFEAIKRHITSVSK